MNFLHKAVDWILSRNQFIKEFCFLVMPFKLSTDGLYNAKIWNEYLSSRPDIVKTISDKIDLISVRLIKRLLKRRKQVRYFLTLPEIIGYYKAKFLHIPYWFPSNGTLLKTVFLYKAGTAFLPKDRIGLIANRIAIDGGAASGDSSIALLDAGVRKVFAFEPSPLQRKEMQEVFLCNNCSDKIGIIPFALSDKKGTVQFNDQYGQYYTVDSVSIDEYCENEDIGCIKLDIEGAEFPVLRGAHCTISRCKPVLIICAYHRPEDLFEIPSWILTNFPDYNLYLRDTEPGNRSVGVHIAIIAYPTEVK